MSILFACPTFIATLPYQLLIIIAYYPSPESSPLAPSPRTTDPASLTCSKLKLMISAHVVGSNGSLGRAGPHISCLDFIIRKCKTFFIRKRCTKMLFQKEEM